MFNGECSWIILLTSLKHGGFDVSGERGTYKLVLHQATNHRHIVGDEETGGDVDIRAAAACLVAGTSGEEQ